MRQRSGARRPGALSRPEADAGAGPAAPHSGAALVLQVGFGSGSFSTKAKRSVGTCATSGPGTQRSRPTASTTSRLSHPVSRRLPRLAARPRGALLLLHLLLQCATRKRPSL